MAEGHAKGVLPLPLEDRKGVALDFVEVWQRLKVDLVAHPPVDQDLEPLKDEVTLRERQSALFQGYIGRVTG